jgi:hypothetical protein
LETQLELAQRLGYLDANTDAMLQVNRVGRLVRSLRNSLRRKLKGDEMKVMK